MLGSDWTDDTQARESFGARAIFFGRVGPTTASVGLPLKRLERETTLVGGMNGRIPSPVCAFDEYLRDGETTILRALNYADLSVFPIKIMGNSY